MNKTGYYYLPKVSRNKQVLQCFIDSIHTICFTIGGAISGMMGQYWYTFLTRLVLEIFVFFSMYLTYYFSLDRRNAIFVSMIFQLMASILMIITLEIYRVTIINVLENKGIAVALLYISRFLSGCSAGKHDNYYQKKKKSKLLKAI
jgi:hypothetical protein